MLVAAARSDCWHPSPGRALARHDAVNIVLVVLVLSAALTVPVRGRRAAPAQRAPTGCRHRGELGDRRGRRVGVAHLVDAGPLRFGVIAVGVAPVEIATLGVAPLGGGDSLASGVMLIGSTVLTALFAGPVSRSSVAAPTCTSAT